MSDSSLWSQLVDTQHLRRSWIRAWRNASLDALYYDRYGYSTFAEDLEANLIVLRAKLITHEFEFEPLYSIGIPKDGGGERRFYYPTVESAVVLEALLGVVGPLIESRLLGVSYGNRLNPDVRLPKTFLDWQERFALYKDDICQFAVRHPDYYFHRTDIKSYYPSIEHEEVLIRLAQVVQDEEIVNLTRRFLKTLAINEQGQEFVVEGLPVGVSLVHVLANLYLTGLDASMEEEASAYFRYVDDIFLFSETQEDIEKARISFERQLDQIKLRPTDNLDKLVTDSCANIQRIETVLEQISEQIFTTFTLDIDENARKQVARFLYNVFIQAQGFDSPRDVYRYAGFAIGRLKALGFVVDHDNIYAFLQSNLLRSTSIRTLVLYLLNDNLTNTTERFIDYINGAPPHIKIVFLQSIPSDTPISQALLSLTADMLRDGCLFVRGEAAQALTNLFPTYSASFPPLSIDACLRPGAFSYERTRALGLSVLITNGVNEYVRNFLSVTSDYRLNNVGLHIAYQAFEVGGDVDDLLSYIRAPNLREHRPNITVAYITIALSLILRSIVSDRDRDAILDNVAHHLAWFTDEDKERLLRCADLGLPEENMRTLLEALVKQRLKTIDAQGLFLFDYVDGQLGFNDYLIERQLDTGGTPDYSCWLGRSGNTRVFIEVIDMTLLSSRGFEGISSWTSFLQSLDEVGLISLESVELRRQSQVITVYNIPDGYWALSEWTTNDNLPVIGFVVAFRIMANVVKSIRQINTNSQPGYLYFGINANFVFCAADYTVKLVALGFSLLATPRYLSSTSPLNRLDQEGDGYPTLSKYLGFLLFEILTKKCPVRSREEALAKDVYLTDDEHLKKYPAHVTAFIKRASNEIAQYRYTDEQLLGISRDINHVQRFSEWLDTSTASELETHMVLFVEYVDYIHLRLYATLADPELQSASIWKKLTTIGYRLSRDTATFIEKRGTVKMLQDKTDLLTLYNGGMRKSLARWINPQSLHLIVLTRAWKQLVLEYNQIPDVDTASEWNGIVEAALLYGAITPEALAYAQAIGRTRTKSIEVLHSDSLQFLISVPSKEFQFAISVEDLGTVSSILALSESEKRKHQASECFDSLTNIAAFVLFASAVSIFQDEHGFTLTFQKSSTTDRIVELAIDLVRFEIICLETIETEEAPQQLPELALCIISGFKRTTPASRHRGENIRYSFEPQAFRICKQLVGILKYRAGMKNREVNYTNRDLLYDQQIADNKPLLVDIHHRRFVSTIIPADIVLFRSLHAHPRWLHRISSKHNLLLVSFIIICVLLLVLAAILPSVDQTLNSVSAILSIAALIWGLIQRRNAIDR